MGSCFRQISVLPQIAKVHKKLQLMLNKSDLRISATQHAFTEERSTVTTLTSIIQDWLNATEPRSPFSGVHALFVDFRKAFDLADHAISLKKLTTMNISRSFWKWVQSYLSGRTLQVKLPGGRGWKRGGGGRGWYLESGGHSWGPPGVMISTCNYADDCTQHELVTSDSHSHVQEVMGDLVAWTDLNQKEITV